MIPALVTMAILICCSAFFSASEAALFYLKWSDRRQLATGNRSQRMAERLLRNPDRLLSAVLFWNLVINILYFTLASMVGLHLERNPNVPQSTVAAFAVGSLLMIIFLSEMLPKSVAVLRARSLAGTIGVPLAVAVNLVDPIMPLLRVITETSRRILWPSLEREASLEIADMERAIEMSAEGDQGIEQEQLILRNIVSLSELDVREWMRPRNQIRSFHPPISRSDLDDEPTNGEFAFVVHPQTQDIVGALPLARAALLPPDSLERYAKRVVCIPWCSTVADALQALREDKLSVAVVVNELGESIGVITEHDVLAAILTNHPERGERLLNRETIVPLDDQTWQIEGVTNLSRLERLFEVELPTSRNVTVGGIVQEALERLPVVGDRCQWGPFEIDVIQAGKSDLQVTLRLIDENDAAAEDPA
jgi:Mg2+/Co2+ transporter CorB